MRLSEAMRLGAIMGPQAYGDLTRTRRKYILFGPVVTEYCALGAAHAAVGARSVQHVATGNEAPVVPFRGKAYKRKKGQIYSQVEHDSFDFDPSWRVVACPACTKKSGRVFEVIPHLNDAHKWTREHIADWVETLEPRSTETTTTPVVGSAEILWMDNR